MRDTGQTESTIFVKSKRALNLRKANFQLLGELVNTAAGKAP